MSIHETVDRQNEVVASAKEDTVLIDTVLSSEILESAPTQKCMMTAYCMVSTSQQQDRPYEVRFMYRHYYLDPQEALKNAVGLPVRRIRMPIIHLVPLRQTISPPPTTTIGSSSSLQSNILDTLNNNEVTIILHTDIQRIESVHSTVLESTTTVPTASTVPPSTVNISNHEVLPESSLKSVITTLVLVPNGSLSVVCIRLLSERTPDMNLSQITQNQWNIRVDQIVMAFKRFSSFWERSVGHVKNISAKKNNSTDKNNNLLSPLVEINSSNEVQPLSKENDPLTEENNVSSTTTNNNNDDDNNNNTSYPVPSYPNHNHRQGRFNNEKVLNNKTRKTAVLTRNNHSSTTTKNNSNTNSVSSSTTHIPHHQSNTLRNPNMSSTSYTDSTVINDSSSSSSSSNISSSHLPVIATTNTSYVAPSENTSVQRMYQTIPVTTMNVPYNSNSYYYYYSQLPQQSYQNSIMINNMSPQYVLVNQLGFENHTTNLSPSSYNNNLSESYVPAIPVYVTPYNDGNMQVGTVGTQAYNTNFVSYNTVGSSTNTIPRNNYYYSTSNYPNTNN